MRGIQAHTVRGCAHLLAGKALGVGPGRQICAACGLPRSETNFGGVTPPTHHEGIYLADLYDPCRRIARPSFRVFAILLVVMPVIIFFGVPTLLHILATLPRHGDGLLFGRQPIEIAPHVYPYAFAVYAYVVVVVCVNRLRAAGRSLWWLLVPGYNVYLLFFAPDR